MITQATLDFTGTHLRNAGIASVENHSADWQIHAAQIIESLAQTGRRFSPDDFHARLQFLPHHPNAIGAAFRRAQLAGVIKRIGWQQSERAAAHARVVAVYLGVS
jgi:hypothetical protein